MACRIPDRGLIILVLMLLFSSATAAEQADAAMAERFAPFQTLLDRHLEERRLDGGGLVSAFDYRAALAAEDTAELLASQRQRLAAFNPAELRSREEAIAFWLNAYNHFMIDHILQHPRNGEPVGSVRDFGHLLNPYRVFRQRIFDVGGQRYSLDDMEKGILLGADYAERGWKDARVHFAVNCASVGCPPLRATIYLPSTLNQVLDDNTRRALATARHLQRQGDTLRLSRLFDWYRRDYEDEAGSVEAFLLQHADERVRAEIEQTRRIRFIDYDWRLNEAQNFVEFHRPAGD